MTKPFNTEASKDGQGTCTEDCARREAQVALYDPQAMENMKEVFKHDPPRVIYKDSAETALVGANAALLVTEWDVFRRLNIKKARESMANPIIIDGRNILDPADLMSLGFEYYSVGRGKGV